MENKIFNKENPPLVLVTGGTGFIGVHCILQLLKQGYKVRTTVRSLKRQQEVLSMLKKGGVEPGSSLSFVEADLLSDQGWPEAVAGCDYVLHVASPFPSGEPKDENELIIPAREGALRVLKASRDAKVKRVVLTSSFAAIGYGTTSSKPYSEENWTNTNGKVSAYVKSKTIAEKAAWDFITREGAGLELSVVNPVGVFGPVLGMDYSTSILLVKRLMDGSMPGCPQLSFGIVDVRDVVNLHLKAMIHPAAKGERFLAIAGDFMTIKEIGLALTTKMGEAAKRVPKRELPNWLVRIFALFDSEIALIIPELGKTKSATNEKARTLLGWQPRSPEEAVAATAESLIELGVIK